MRAARPKRARFIDVPTGDGETQHGTASVRLFARHKGLGVTEHVKDRTLFVVTHLRSGWKASEPFGLQKDAETYMRRLARGYDWGRSWAQVMRSIAKLRDLAAVAMEGLEDRIVPEAEDEDLL